MRLGGEAPLHIKAVLPHSGTLPQERARIGRHHAVVGQREYLLTMRPDVAVLPPARLLPSEDRTLPTGRRAWLRWLEGAVGRKVYTSPTHTAYLTAPNPPAHRPIVYWLVG